MKHVSILIPTGNSVLSSIVGPYKVLKGASDYLIASGQRQDNYFDIHLVGHKKHVELYDGAFSIRATDQLKDVKTTDLIIIPAIVGDIPAEVQNNIVYFD